MDVKFLENEKIIDELSRLMDDYSQYYWAVAWGTRHDAAEQLIRNKDKIKKIVIGTHFYQTDPDLLTSFVDNDNVRVMPSDMQGVFHPKVYLFESDGGKSAAIIGSANFTKSAFNKNIEASVVISGETTEDIFVSIKNMIESSWLDSIEIDIEFIDAYRMQYIATSRYREKLREKRKRTKPKIDAKHQNLKRWDWSEYIENIYKDRFHSVDGRIELLSKARNLFDSVNSFSELNKDQRRAIAGMLSKGKKLEPGIDIDWGWFGSMVGMGEFQSVINENSNYISEALDHIPLTGDIAYSQYLNYIKLFRKAFEEKSRKGGVPTASRLLAMKRPDMFLCVDKHNRNSLADDLGFAKSTLDFDKYWYEVVMPITESVWWQKGRPTGKDGVIWENRAAMLDCIYYEEM